MPARSKVLGNRPIGGEKPLRVARRLESLHAPFPLARGLMGVLRTVVEIPMLAVLDTREDLPLRRPVTLELIRDEHPWYVLTSLEELAEELLGRLFVPPSLHQDVEDVPVLVDRPPQVVAFLVDRDEHLVQMPLVAWPRTPTP
jgi:hypothetical protein